MNFRFTISIIFAACLSVSAFNHPEISWKSVPTEHFVINFYDKTEPAVYATWKVAEEVYSSLSKKFDYSPHQKIRISIAEYDDYSNGWAAWTSGSIMIWVPDLRFDLRSNTVWLRNVITHEMTHIITLEKRRRRQMFDATVNLSLTTPNGSLLWQEPFARMTMVPDWAAEGVAQLETKHNGNDCWDSRRDMILRCAVLANKALSYDEMGHFNHTSLGNEMVYNQGFSFCQYLENRLGTETFNNLYKQVSSERVSFDQILTERCGMTPYATHKQWIDSLRGAYQSNIPSKPTLTSPIWTDGFINTLPRVSPDGALWGWLTNANDDADRTELIIARYGTTDIVIRIPYVHTSWTFSKDSKIYFIRSREPNRDGSYFNDIYMYNLKTGDENRLTHDARVYDLSASPDGKTLLCTNYDKGAFNVNRFDCTSLKFSLVRNTILGEPFMNSCYNPNNSGQAVITKVENGISKLFLLDKDSLTPLTSNSSGQEETPYWAKDGRIYYSADYDGIYNIYSISPDSTTPIRHTNAVGGFFTPAIDKDNNIVFSSYGSLGFRIVRAPLTTVEFQMPQSGRCTFTALPVPKGKVTIKAKDYKPTLLRAVWEMQVFGDLVKNKNILFPNKLSVNDTTSYNVGAAIMSSQSDALNKNARYFGAAIGAIGGSVSSSDNSANHANLQPAIRNNLSLINQTAQSANDKLYNNIHSSINNCNFTKNSPYRNLVENTAATSSDSTDSTQGQMPLLFIQPTIGWESSTSTATVGFSLQAILVQIILPAMINMNLSSDWQLSREVSFGIAPQVQIAPFTQAPSKLYGALPLYINWSHLGHYNKDLGYNSADLSLLQVMAGPYFPPAQKISYDSTINVSPMGYNVGLGVQHGFPIARYGSLVLSLQSIYEHTNQKILDNIDVLGGESDAYLSGEIGGKVVFPFLKSINRKIGLYFDGLYGDVGYYLLTRANAKALKNLGNYNDQLLSNPQTDPDNIVVNRLITAGITLGHYKSYAFFRETRLDFSYEILNKSTRFGLTTGF